MLPSFGRRSRHACLDDLLECIQRKALRIIFGKTEYANAMAMASLGRLKAKRVACQRVILNARQHPPLVDIIPYSWEYE